MEYKLYTQSSAKKWISISSTSWRSIGQADLIWSAYVSLDRCHFGIQTIWISLEEKKRESDLINQSRDIWTWHLPETFQKVDCHTLPSHDLQRLGNSWQKTLNSTIERLQFRSFYIWKKYSFIQSVLPQVFLKLASGCQHILHFPLYIISYGQLEALKRFKCET